MVTGTPVFAAETVIDTLHAVLYREVPPLGRVRADAPPALARIVHRCLARDPASRYQSTADLVADLQDVPRSIVAAPSVPRPRRWWTLGFALSVVSLLVLMVAMFAFGHERQPMLQNRDTVLIGDAVNLTRDRASSKPLAQKSRTIKHLAQSPRKGSNPVTHPNKTILS
jgi:eukaryotic-like serine/threonine-protein kinase